jgi:hypothetical protein
VQPSRPLQIVWSALWRAQATHLVLFAAAPLLVAILHVVLGILALPFTLLSFGDRSLSYGHQVSHLRQPGCWIVLATCDVANRELVSLPWENVPASPADVPNAPEVEPFIPLTLPSGLTPRHLWFFIWLGWFLLFLRRWRKHRDA